MSKSDEAEDFINQQITKEEIGNLPILGFYNVHTTVNTKGFPLEAIIKVEAGGKVTFLKQYSDSSWWEAHIEASKDKDLEIKLSALIFEPELES